MGDWVTPSSNPVLNVGVTADVNIGRVTIYWNGKILRSWIPRTISFSQTLDIDISGVLRVTAEDHYGKYRAYSNPIFLKPTIPHIKETTNPVDLEAKYSDNKLMITVSAPTDQTSTTKVCCGDARKPVAIYTANGTLTPSYATSTKILTLNVTHASPTRISVYWKLPCDIDNDGDVDVDDFSVLAGAYGYSSGHPAYNPEADIDGDGDVDYDDFIILAGNYGENL